MIIGKSAIFLLLSLVTGLAAAQVDARVVGIFAKSPAGTQVATGFLISSSGEVVTAFHVLQNSSSVVIVNQDKSIVDTGGLKVTYLNGKTDIAVIRVPALVGRAFFDLTPRAPTTSESLRAVGYPNGSPNAVVAARSISNKLLTPEESPFRTSTGPILQGNIKVIGLDMTTYGGISGAPLLDKEEKVLGLVSGSINTGGSFAWAIPSTYIELALADTKNTVGTALSDTNWPRLNLLAAGAKNSVRSFQSRTTAEEWLTTIELLSAQFSKSTDFLVVEGKTAGKWYSGHCAMIAGELKLSKELGTPFKLISFGANVLSGRGAKLSYTEYRRNLEVRLSSGRELKNHFDGFITNILDNPKLQRSQVDDLNSMLENLYSSGALDIKEEELRDDILAVDDWIAWVTKIPDANLMTERQTEMMIAKCPGVTLKMQRFSQADDNQFLKEQVDFFMDFYDTARGLVASGFADTIY